MSEFNLESYLSDGVENIVKGAIKASLKNPKESLFMAQYAVASRKARELRKKAEAVGEHIPPFLIASITSQCNLHCIGCYARANHACHDQKVMDQLSDLEWKRIFEEAKQLGIGFILLAGSEPMVRKDVITAAASMKSILFPIFTNGTMIDEEYIKLLKDNRNLVPVISLEGNEEALTLFAKKGYAGTSIKEIADAVSIKDSSLYKHYKSKREIFDTIVSIMGKRMEQLSIDLNLVDVENEDGIEQLKNMNLEQLVELTQKVFIFYAKDEFAAKFRRMITIEQYNNSDVSDLYRKIYMEDSIKYQTMLFQKLIDAKVLKLADPWVLAMRYYTPIYFLICRYDNDNTKEEESLEMVKKCVAEFYRVYKNDESL